MLPFGPLGAHLIDDNTTLFRVWAPDVESMALVFAEHIDDPIRMDRDQHGYWSIEATAPAGTRYQYRINGGDLRPDPASRSQPEGVHGPSEVADMSAHRWMSDSWRGIPREQLIIYELHIGTFTHEGTFDAAIARLDDLADLGVNAIEIMPIAQFPGARNWGYDGVNPFAAQSTYGGPSALMRLVDEAHQRGIAVILDVVYNHLGPEGNYLWAYTHHYFTDRYQTPWGHAINFDGPHSDHVRHFFIESALMWLRDFRIDGLRLDATHAIFDFSAHPYLAELAEAVESLSRDSGHPRLLIAESDANDPRLVRTPALGGLGLDAQWVDDYHHAVHTLLTGELDGYYADYGTLDILATSLGIGYTHTGGESPFRQRRHGQFPHNVTPGQFVVCIQNHDQVGNRMLGDRFSHLLDHEQRKVAAALLLLAPFVPMLFMGEEHAAPEPFLYFVDHGDQALIEGVRQGRREEFKAFAWKGEVPDPIAEESFKRSTIDWTAATRGPHAQLRAWYRALIELRHSRPAMEIPSRLGEVRTWTFPAQNCLILERRCEDDRLIAFINLSPQPQDLPTTIASSPLRAVFHSADAAWGGPDEALPNLAESQVVTLPPWSVLIAEEDSRE